ncbi:MAG: hypothetical protein JRI61_13090 [Deltaproteobacteria bacterium]|nr:hypothetical protein [Deltaproteobacteria bacterium]
MSEDEKNRELAFRIAGILEKGLILNDRVLHFMDTTFGSFLPENMKEVVQDDERCERESLLELIFFPDESIQVQIEDILCAKEYTEEDETGIIDSLVSRIQSVELDFPESPGKLKISFSRESAKKFVSRLKVSSTPDKELIRSVKKYVAPNRAGLVLVKLRNAAIPRTDNVIDFLSRFFQKIGSDRPDFLDCLAFILKFSQGMDEKSNIFQSLMDRKKSCVQAVEKAAEYEKQLARYNMEIMIMKGERNPCVNIDEIKKTIAIIDRISLSVFNRSDSLFDNL